MRFSKSLRTGKIHASHQLAVPGNGRKALGARRSGIPKKIRRDVFRLREIPSRNGVRDDKGGGNDKIAAFLKAAPSKKLLFIPKLVGGTFNFALADNFINTLAEKRFCVNIEKFTFMRNIKCEALDIKADTHDR